MKQLVDMDYMKQKWLSNIKEVMVPNTSYTVNSLFSYLKRT